METIKISREIKKNIETLRQILPIQESFDLIQRDMIIGGRDASFYFVDGFTKDEAMLKIMDALFGVSDEAMPEDASSFTNTFLPYVEVEMLCDMDQVCKNVLSGVTCLFVDGYDECIAIDCRTYPVRGVEEPDKDKSLRGSRDGFVETIVFNTALMRRRIRDPHLVMEMKEVGTSSRTDVALCYITDRVNPQLLADVRTRISKMQVDALKMNQQTLAEGMFKRKWFNPFLTGVYLKLSRILITILTVFMTPVFLLYMQNPGWLPSLFSFVSVQGELNLPILLQFLILELAIDGLRLAALNTPNMLSTPLSVIAGIVMGDYAVESGWFNSEVMLYMAFVAVANYTQPNFELGYALKFMRLMLLILTALFNRPGFLIGTVLVFCFVAFNKTLSGNSYLRIRRN